MIPNCLFLSHRLWSFITWCPRHQVRGPLSYGATRKIQTSQGKDWQEAEYVPDSIVKWPYEIIIWFLRCRFAFVICYFLWFAIFIFSLFILLYIHTYIPFLFLFFSPLFLGPLFFLFLLLCRWLLELFMKYIWWP